MADYSSLQIVKGYLGELWGPDRPTLQGGGTSSRDSWLANQITVCSRLFDRETGRPANWWQSAPGSTRVYSGDGSTFLDVDEWDAITAVTMSTLQDRSDAITLDLAPTSSDANYVGFDPNNGPPWNRLYLIRGWLPDIYDVGNIHVTGTPTLPPEISDAIAIWVCYRFKRRDAGFSDPGKSQHAGQTNGPGYSGDVPMEVLSIIEYYRSHERGTGVHIAMVSGMPSGNGYIGGVRRPLWLGWTTQ